MLNAVCAAAIRRAGVDYVPWSKAFTLLLTGMLPLLPVLAMAGSLWAERRPLRSHPAYASIRFLMAWAACALLGVLITKAMFAVYILPLLQPLCLAAGGFAQLVLGRVRARTPRLALQTAAIAAAVLYSWWAASSLLWAGEDSVKAAGAAAALMAREGERAGDRILVVDRDLLVYVAAGAEPAFPIFHPQQLLCGFPAQGAGTALSDAMNASPAFVIVARPPQVRACELPSRRAAIEPRLAQHYCELGRFESTVTGWPGGFIVLGLKERLGPASREACGKRSRIPGGRTSGTIINRHKRNLSPQPSCNLRVVSMATSQPLVTGCVECHFPNGAFNAPSYSTVQVNRSLAQGWVEAGGERYRVRSSRGSDCAGHHRSHYDRRHEPQGRVPVDFGAGSQLTAAVGRQGCSCRIERSFCTEYP